jgi:transcription initiation factor TFIIA large subunit
VAKDEEAINSDLDDSDTENEAEAEEGGAGDTDIVFCTYDKVIIFFSILFLVGDAYQVARVKNKWKCILKDGMIHVNGKDYLFAKCTGSVISSIYIPVFIAPLTLLLFLQRV